MDIWKLWLYALLKKTPMCQIFCERRNADMTHEMGIIFRYRLGKGTPARLTCRRVKDSGTLSSFKVAESTSAMRSLVRPTQILNSFMLHGCSEHLSRSGMGGGYLEPKTDVCGAAGRTTWRDRRGLLKVDTKYPPSRKLCYLGRFEQLFRVG